MVIDVHRRPEAEIQALGRKVHSLTGLVGDLHDQMEANTHEPTGNNLKPI